MSVEAAGSILEQAEGIKQQLLQRLEIATSATQEIEDVPFEVLPGGANLTEHELATEDDLAAIVDVNVVAKTSIVSARMVQNEVPITKLAARTTELGQSVAEAILDKKDDRLLVIAGPCSVHDPEEFFTYAEWLKEQRERFADDLEIIVRAYFEKPRSAVGWPGFLYDPRMDDSHDINLGVIASRMVARRVAEMGIPTATERLNPTDIPVFFNGLITYDAIGARNVTDQAARKYASATSSVVGLKNPLDGTIEPARDAIIVANSGNQFIGSDMDGGYAKVESSGNPYAHLILRGGADGPNYGPEHVVKAVNTLQLKGLLSSIVVDCSHGNSGKNPDRQIEVAKSLAAQLAGGQHHIVGAMVESYLQHGNQNIAPRHQLKDGISVTDACADLGQTGEILKVLASGVRARRLAA